ncbi:hypothetical protein CNMCM7691_007752 [Aspergillus felis]|uniref:Ecp2 effector protein-like domain-containing protein n=1 Tax=Aspergillus felis TaxID=1287682 RepID=A0A8H6QTS2_9EURO|nr:hypothetical protein CNMCM7691_007752 [Aspergillus felis]
MVQHSWDQSGGPYTNVANYPCIPHQVPDHCGDSVFVSLTTDASLSVSDCMQIVKNIQNTDGDWEVRTRSAISTTSCSLARARLGSRARGKTATKFGGSGKAGAKGVKSCDGTVKVQ